MDVAVSTLRRELASWLRRVQDGEEVVVTDRGAPVARLLPVGTTAIMDDLVARGVVSPPTGLQRPSARGIQRVRASGPVADLVAEQRR